MIVLGSSCIYPRQAPQPILEDYLLTGPLEPTNEGYAVAKIAALELGKMYNRQHGMDVLSLMPTNLYGPNDNFDLETAHVLPALLRKVARGPRQRRRGRDLGHRRAASRVPARRRRRRCGRVLHGATWSATRTSTSASVTTSAIRELAELIADVVGWQGEFRFRADRPDGTPRKLLDVGRLRSLGWKERIELREGIESTYRWFLEHEHDARGTH